MVWSDRERSELDSTDRTLRIAARTRLYQRKAKVLSQMQRLGKITPENVEVAITELAAHATSSSSRLERPSYPLDVQRASNSALTPSGYPVPSWVHQPPTKATAVQASPVPDPQQLSPTTSDSGSTHSFAKLLEETISGSSEEAGSPRSDSGHPRPGAQVKSCSTTPIRRHDSWDCLFVHSVSSVTIDSPSQFDMDSAVYGLLLEDVEHRPTGAQVQALIMSSVNSAATSELTGNQSDIMFVIFTDSFD